MYTKRYFFVALCDAAKLGDSKTILALSNYTIEYSKMINDRNWNTGHAPLHIATSMNNAKAVETILKYYAFVNVNQRTLYAGKTPLMIAVENKNVKIVSHLLQHGANPNIEDVYGKVPIYNLFTSQDCCRRCSNIIKKLIKYNFDINKPIDNDQNRLIHFVTVKSPNYKVAKLLLKSNVSLNIKNNRDQIPLCEVPKKFSNDEANKLLKYAGYDSQSQDTCSIGDYEEICAKYMPECTFAEEITLIMYRLKWSIGFCAVNFMITSGMYFKNHDFFAENIKSIVIKTLLVPLGDGFYRHFTDQFNCTLDAYTSFQ